MSTSLDDDLDTPADLTGYVDYLEAELAMFKARVAELDERIADRDAELGRLRRRLNLACAQWFDALRRNLAYLQAQD